MKSTDHLESAKERHLTWKRSCLQTFASKILGHEFIAPSETSILARQSRVIFYRLGKSWAFGSSENWLYTLIHTETAAYCLHACWKPQYWRFSMLPKEILFIAIFVIFWFRELLICYDLLIFKVWSFNYRQSQEGLGVGMAQSFKYRT